MDSPANVESPIKVVEPAPAEVKPWDILALVLKEAATTPQEQELAEKAIDSLQKLKKSFPTPPIPIVSYASEQEKHFAEKALRGLGTLTPKDTFDNFINQLKLLGAGKQTISGPWIDGASGRAMGIPTSIQGLRLTVDFRNTEILPSFVDF